MTLTTTTSKISYAGDGSTVSFSIPFLFLTDGDITATLRDANGVETTWVLNTEYTLAGAGVAAGGTLTVKTSPTDYTPAGGETLVIRRIVPETQGTDYPEGGAFPASAHEDALDRLTMLVQQKSEELARALVFPTSDPASSLGTVPNSTDRASKFLGFDAAGKPIASTGSVDTLPVSGFMATVLDDSNAAAARTTLGVGTAATKNFGTSANELVELDGSAKLPAVDGSQLTGLVGATDVRLAFLLIAENAGDRLNMIDGIADPFTDETDVDTGTSANETYDAAGDFYSNPGSTTYGNFGLAGTGSGPSFGDGTANRKHVGIAFTTTAAGDITSVKVDVVSVSTGFNCHVEIWTDSAGSPGSQVEGDSDTVNLNSTGDKIFTWSSAVPTLSDATKYWVVLVDEGTTGVIQLDQDDVGDQTGYETGASDTITSISEDSGGFNSDTRHEVIAGGGTSPNMTLVSNAFTADAAPATGRILFQAKPVDSITLNTDLVAEISRDNGTTWTTAALVEKETLADGTKAYEDDSVDISGQPSGTSMKYRIKTLNNKEVEIHGVVLQWT